MCRRRRHDWQPHKQRGNLLARLQLARDVHLIVIHAHHAIKLTVKNLDSTAEEFESKPLKVEKVIAGNATAVIRLKAQSKGSYKFFGEYHEKTAQGVLIVE